MGTTVTVASAGGEDYTSVRAALIAISSGASEADKNTVLIMDSSTYSEDFDDSSIMNKSYLILKANTGETPILWSTGGVFKIQGGSYWEIDGIEFKISDSSTRTALYFYTVSGCYGNVVKNCIFTVAITDNYYGGVRFSGGYDDVEVEFQNCIFRNSYSGYYGRYVKATAAIYPKIKFIECEFQKGYQHLSISLPLMTSVSATYYFTFDRCTFTAGREPSYINGANLHFHACLFYNFTYYGSDTRKAMQIYGGNTGKGLEILKCTFYNCADGAILNPSNVNDSQSAVKDNIFYSCGTIDTIGNKYGSGFDYNCLFFTSHDAGYGGIGSYSNTSDPKFNAPGSDFTLQSDSPCIDYGTSLSSYGVTADLATDSLPLGGSWDMGAYEYDPPPSDGGIDYANVADCTTINIYFLTGSSYPDVSSGENTDNWNIFSSESGSVSLDSAQANSDYEWEVITENKLYKNITYIVNTNNISSSGGGAMNSPGTSSFTGSCWNGGISNLTPSDCYNFTISFNTGSDTPDQTSVENLSNWLFKESGVSQSLSSISKSSDYVYDVVYGSRFLLNTAYELVSLSASTDTGGDVNTPGSASFLGFCYVHGLTSSATTVGRDYAILTHQVVKNDRNRNINQLPFMYGLGNTSVFGFRNTTVAKKVTK